ncbi:tetratricopeptide repeat protein [Candidatus Parabeggiatoa sp. HSG14]|uniref:tetratricopeptide repeat protein n=1 Tax=Candidatus Parabeggiatoa sp. HSG14 TaxID=3055593 RepID=UPI0025A8477E|nr:tetratricopeptide repeat protein [Thiotrichales bacterium HSG14]
MSNINNWSRLHLGLLFIMLFMVIAENALANFIKVDSTSAIESLLNDAKEYYETEQYEQAAATLERALRLNPRHPILWHNLAGVRLAQEDWKRAAHLANKSNTLLSDDEKSKKIQLRNWVLITQACEGMGDENCAYEARNRAQTLVQRLSP